MRIRCATLVLGCAIASSAEAQWTHRYPKIAGLSHHVYLEGYELPTLAAGPLEPAVSPDGSRIAFASRGWIWLLDPATGAATRLTNGAGIDSRPAWSPDGGKLAFVRDDTRFTRIVVRDLSAGSETVTVDDHAIDLDPAFAPDGKSLYYASSSAGDFDIWRVDLASKQATRVTETKGQELKPMPHPDGKRLVFLSKGGRALDAVMVRDLAAGTDRTLASGAILSMLRPALSPDGRLVAMNWPASDASGWDLRLIGVDQPGPTVLLTKARGLPLSPAWSPDGRAVYYAEANDKEVMELFRISPAGGMAEPVPVAGWNWGAPTGRIRVLTRRTDRANRLTPARLAIQDQNGHPLIPDEGQSRFDGQNGLNFFYSGGSIDLEVPTGTVVVSGVQGLATPVASAHATVAPGAIETVTLDLSPVWDPEAHGWLAGEHHFHLNYGGPFRLTPDDLLPMAEGEAMDVLTPLLANLHTRFEDQQNWSWHHTDRPPFVEWGQEVRAHFFGHVGLIAIPDLFWPWVWGPGYEVYGRDDRPNREPLEHARKEGGMNFYVHPIMAPDPFAPANLATIPVGFVPDLVQGLIDGLEVACIWSDEKGSMELWYRALNLGVPLAPSAGTDVMNNLYRTMAVGATRVYVKSDPALGIAGYYAGLKAGRSFVTTGPLLELTVAGAEPGGVVPDKPKRAAWKLAVHSAGPVEKIEIVVNGAVVSSHPGLTAAGSTDLSGTIDLPPGGWIGARAIGGATQGWPAMDSYAFAHTAPIWIGRRGSTMPATKRKAAEDLLAALDVAETAMRAGYDQAPGPQLTEHYRKAREILTEMIGASATGGR